MHSGFVRSATSLPVITGDAAGNDVSPGFSTSLDNWDDMVECKILRGASLAAVLASMMIPGIDICSAEFHVSGSFSKLYVF